MPPLGDAAPLTASCALALSCCSVVRILSVAAPAWSSARFFSSGAVSALMRSRDVPLALLFASLKASIRTGEPHRLSGCEDPAALEDRMDDSIVYSTKSPTLQPGASRGVANLDGAKICAFLRHRALHKALRPQDTPQSQEVARRATAGRPVELRPRPLAIPAEHQTRLKHRCIISEAAWAAASTQVERAHSLCLSLTSLLEHPLDTARACRDSSLRCARSALRTLLVEPRRALRTLRAVRRPSLYPL